MNLSDLLAQEPNASTLSAWLKKVPYAAYLGIRADVRGDDILFVMPGDEKLIGNPALPALHGGVVGAFMEQAGTFHLLAKMENPVLPKIIDFSLDYLRSAQLRDALLVRGSIDEVKLLQRVVDNVVQFVGVPDAVVLDQLVLFAT